jgi:hypothetical protein
MRCARDNSTCQPLVHLEARMQALKSTLRPKLRPLARLSEFDWLRTVRRRLKRGARPHDTPGVCKDACVWISMEYACCTAWGVAFTISLPAKVRSRGQKFRRKRMVDVGGYGARAGKGPSRVPKRTTLAGMCTRN